MTTARKPKSPFSKKRSLQRIGSRCALTRWETCHGWVSPMGQWAHTTDATWGGRNLASGRTCGPRGLQLRPCNIGGIARRFVRKLNGWFVGAVQPMPGEEQTGSGALARVPQEVGLPNARAPAVGVLRTVAR